MRKVHVGATNTPWEYKVFKSGTVVIKSPEGRKIVTDACAIKKISPDTFERGCWKRTSDGIVFPSEVKGFIETEV